MSRSQFIRKLVNKASVAGVLVYGAAVADAFVAPPARAQTSGTTQQKPSTVSVFLPFFPKTVTTITVANHTVTVTNSK